MQVVRQQRQPKLLGSLFMLTVSFSLLLCILYFQWERLRGNREAAVDRCNAELRNVKHQLDSVLDTKGKMDTMMVELQQNCDLEKEALREYSINFISMKRNYEICELQAKNLEMTCKHLKVKLDHATEQLAACKSPG